MVTRREWHAELRSMKAGQNLQDIGVVQDTHQNTKFSLHLCQIKNVLDGCLFDGFDSHIPKSGMSAEENTAKGAGPDDPHKAVVTDSIIPLCQVGVLLRDVGEYGLRCFPHDLSQGNLIMSLPSLFLRPGEFCLSTFNGLSDSFMPSFGTLNGSLEVPESHWMRWTGKEHTVGPSGQHGAMKCLGRRRIPIRTSRDGCQENCDDGHGWAVGGQLLTGRKEIFCVVLGGRPLHQVTWGMVLHINNGQWSGQVRSMMIYRSTSSTMPFFAAPWLP